MTLNYVYTIDVYNPTYGGYDFVTATRSVSAQNEIIDFLKTERFVCIPGRVHFKITKAGIEAITKIPLDWSEEKFRMHLT